MFRAQVFRLYPTAEQEVYFRRTCGAARFAWNWALTLRERYYRRYGKAVYDRAAEEIEFTLNAMENAERMSY